MALSNTFTVAFQRDSGAPISKTITKTGDAGPPLSITIPASSTDYSVNFPLDVSALISAFIVASAAMTIETNDGAAPDATIPLEADTPVVFWGATGQTNPFDDTDVVTLKVTSVAGGTLEIYTLVDPTP